MVEPFERLESRTLLETRIFRLREDIARHPVTGHTAPYMVLENPDWVNIVPLTDAGDIVLVRQWRHGTRALELEIPAGLVDPGEDTIDAAARELREETGFVARHLEVLGKVAPNAAFQSNLCHTVLATGCQPLAEQDFDDGEDLEVVLASVLELPGLLHAGQLRNGMVVCGLFWWLEQTGRITWQG